MGMEVRIQVSDPASGFRGFVVVNDFVDGRAMGGTRMTPQVDLQEVAGLAEAMTLKLALAGLPIGGAKAGIVCGLPAGPERDRQLTAFGQAVAPLLRNGVYLGCDQGISYRDRDFFFEAADFDVQRDSPIDLPCNWSELWARCHDITGFGVCEAVTAATEQLGLDARCRTVAVQGFGTVGRSVAGDLSGRGFKVVAVADRHGTIADPAGLDVDRLIAATDEYGSIDRGALGVAGAKAADAWLDVDADVLVLAAGGDAVTAANVDRVRASIVVEGGNLACSPAACDRLAQRGVPVLPGIVVNCGGAAVTGLLLLGAAPAGAGVDELVDWLFTHVSRRIRGNIAVLLDRAKVENRPLYRIADDLAHELLADRDRKLVDA
ncbi:Glu/Leu/Phe/Val dehydrogenase dimerization domain-containing protein [Actinoplanes sp. NPDC049596]|uniref:Glu/Leu/Phe/Val family dehydrogenase n=1 Tax=unclassified Actinoplanes TaxID=2626549 RepID=UPI003439CE68